MLTLLILAILLGIVVVGLNNDVALTPPMGWNPYNVYLCDTEETQYRAAALALVESGLKDRGYQYLNMDCGWQATERTASGAITWNATRIPSGIPGLADYVHSLGLRFGLQSDAGYYSCDDVNGKAHWLGSLGNEQSDANTFSAWGTDYLKYDNCFAVSRHDFVDYHPHIRLEPLYTAMGDALSNADREIVYSMSEWGIQDPALWVSSEVNSWRISGNIGPPASFESLKRIINELVPNTVFAGPGAWNDLDLLEVGNEGLTKVEWAMHFAFWACAKSPLLISTDLTTASDDVLNILKNQGIIAINQDPLGMSISFRRRYTDNYDVWAGPLADGSMVVVLLNWVDGVQSITFELFDVGLVSADITDVWTGSNLAKASTSYTSFLDAHGALVYKLTNTVQAAEPQYTIYFADAPSNVLEGGATLRAIRDSTNVVTNIGFDGALVFVGIDGGTNGGTKLLWISYVNADYTFENTDCSNCRRVLVSVNGGAFVTAEMPISGQEWDAVYDGYMLSMDGFVPGMQNNVSFSNVGAWAPDMYSIGVQIG